MEFKITVNTFFFAIGQIPATFWGVVIGAFFSLGGVLISNKASEKRLIQQFAHEREQKNKEREQVLKREIYLAATEAVVAGLETIGRFSNLEIPNDQVANAFQLKSSAVAKVNVVASSETIQAIAQFMGELNETLMRLWLKRFELQSNRTLITILQKQTAAFESVRDDMATQIRQFNIEGAQDKRKWEVLEQNFNFENGRVIDWANKIVEKNKELFSLQLELGDECVKESNRLIKLTPAILAAIRKELELPFDLDAYMDVLDRQAINQEEMMKRYIEKISSHVMEWTSDKASA